MTAKKSTSPTGNTEPITLHLPLTRHWYDETVKAENPKRTEYREKTERWLKLIYERRARINRVRFSRAYTRTTATFAVSHIDIGPCPIPGWTAPEYIRIHFTELPTNTPGDDAIAT